ncbi:MAG: hypothetical protein NTZ48_06110 [Candidatus Omnitrophica bacterium]|nr:hypothetical protein [Candidatus Omnitrophota bacterium]
MNYCPGAQKYRQPRPEVIKCFYCRSEAEIWTDEFKITCPDCKNPMVRRENGAICLEWCRQAEAYIGEEKFARYKEVNGKKGDLR